MNPTHADTVKRARLQLLDARRTYRHVILDAHYAGASIREIAQAANVTHGAIHQIIKTERARA